jgi:hypothetical protein
VSINLDSPDSLKTEEDIDFCDISDFEDEFVTRDASRIKDAEASAPAGAADLKAPSKPQGGIQSLKTDRKTFVCCKRRIHVLKPSFHIQEKLFKCYGCGRRNLWID